LSLLYRDPISQDRDDNYWLSLRNPVFAKNRVSRFLKMLDKIGDAMSAMTTMKVTEARSKLYRLLDSVAENHEPILITGKRNNAILISEDDWRAIEETMYLLSIPRMRESIIEGLNTPFKELSDGVEW
jgi:antitoxin YefM